MLLIQFYAKTERGNFVAWAMMSISGPFGPGFRMLDPACASCAALGIVPKLPKRLSGARFRDEDFVPAWVTGRSPD